MRRVVRERVVVVEVERKKGGVGAVVRFSASIWCCLFVCLCGCVCLGPGGGGVFVE